MARARSSSRALLRFVSGSRQPIYVVDHRRTMVFCNEACAAWVKCPTESLTGTRCNFHSGAETEGAPRAAARLCPPPECFLGERRSLQISVEGAEGQRSQRQVEFIPIYDEAGQAAAVLAIGQAAEGGSAAACPPLARIDFDAAALHQRLDELRRRHGSAYRLERLAGESPAIRRARDQARLAAETGGRVLVVGPAGSDAEYVARAIHFGAASASPGRLVPLACGLLDAELMQSTITDFKQQTKYAPAGRSTLLLLEVDRLPPDAQNELAGFLNLPDFQLDTIATSEAPLLELAAAGLYQRELAFALGTLVIELPPLGERREDVPLLAQCLVEEMNFRGSAQHSGFSPAALDRLMDYEWPGDTAELAEMVEAAHTAAEAPLIGVADLPKRIELAADAATHTRREPEAIQLDELLKQIESELISRALAIAKGNKSKAAELLGITRARLHRRVSQPGDAS